MARIKFRDVHELWLKVVGLVGHVGLSLANAW